MSRAEGIQKIENLAGIGWLERRMASLSGAWMSLIARAPVFGTRSKTSS